MVHTPRARLVRFIARHFAERKQRPTRESIAVLLGTRDVQGLLIACGWGDDEAMTQNQWHALVNDVTRQWGAPCR